MIVNLLTSDQNREGHLREKNHMRNCLGVLLVTNDIQGSIVQRCQRFIRFGRFQHDYYKNVPFVSALATLETAAPIAPATSGGSSETRLQWILGTTSV